MNPYSMLKDFCAYDNCAPAGVLLPEIKIEKRWYDKLNLKNDIDNLTFLRYLCHSKFKEKNLHTKSNKDEYIDRARYEIGILTELGFIDYILLNWDILNWCHENGIPTGPGRGSAAGSLILYLLGVTKVDPIEHGLYFERFVSKSRARKIEKDGIIYLDGSLLADVDNDIAFDRRQEVIEYIKNRHPERTCRILNLVTLSGKICIKEVGKIVSEYSEQEMNEVSDTIPVHFGKVSKLKDAIEENENFGRWARQNSESFSIAKKLEGLIKNTGVHASGIAISRNRLIDICPIQKTKDGELISCYDMNDIAELTVKFDILGLKTLTVLKDACDQIGINLEDIDINNKDIYTYFQNLESPQGLFQIEADTNFHVCRTIKPKNLEDVSAVIAIARPGALQFMSNYAEYVETGNFQSQHQIFDEILSYTGGVALYQEQLMKMAVKIGFTLDESEQLRRIVGKKKVDQMPAWKEKIAQKISDNQIDPVAGDILWRVAEDSANYSFNKSHSISYAILSIWTTYVKFNYTKQFFLALLRNSKYEQDPYEIIDKISKECQKFGIKILPPDLIKSDIDFTIDGDDIRYGLNSIKGVSEKSLASIIDFRSLGASNKFDVFVLAKQSGINIGVLSSLIQAGALNSLNDDRAKMVYEAQVFNCLTEREKRNFLVLGPKYNYDLFEIWKSEITNGHNIAHDKKPLISEKRKQTLKSKVEPYKHIFVKNNKNRDFANWFFERKLLGYSYSSRIKNIYEGSSYRMGIEEIINEEQGITINIMGCVKEVVNKRTRETNKKYCKFILSDELSEINCFIWEEKLDQLKEEGVILVKENIVSLNGTKMRDASVSVNSLTVLDDRIYMKLSDLK